MASVAAQKVCTIGALNSEKQRSQTADISRKHRLKSKSDPGIQYRSMHCSQGGRKSLNTKKPPQGYNFGVKDDRLEILNTKIYGRYRLFYYFSLRYLWLSFAAFQNITTGLVERKFPWIGRTASIE
jgi:hypothetical protein